MLALLNSDIHKTNAAPISHVFLKAIVEGCREDDGLSVVAEDRGKMIEDSAEAVSASDV